MKDFLKSAQRSGGKIISITITLEIALDFERQLITIFINVHRNFLRRLGLPILLCLNLVMFQKRNYLTNYTPYLNYNSISLTS
jgi:hypothetical protein